jgi:uncharacterized protein DUF929
VDAGREKAGDVRGRRGRVRAPCGRRHVRRAQADLERSRRPSARRADHRGHDCAEENWPLIVALSRFGQFTGLTTSRSPRFEDVPPIDTWTFYGSSYASTYLAFVPVETHSNVLVSPEADKENGASYRVLQRLTPAERAVFDRYDEEGSTPFIDFANRAVQTGSGMLPNLLAGRTWQQLAAALRQPKTTLGATLLNEADTLTAELCRLTGGRPAAACPQPPRPAKPSR